MKHLIVVDNPKKWTLNIPNVDVISAKSYLSDTSYSAMRNVKVFNLCRSYRYQSLGYYVSLLASARGHKPVPNILAIQDLKSQAIIRIASSELDSLIQKSLKPIQGNTFTLSIYFGKNLAKRHNQLSQRLFAQFQAPLLRAEFIKKDSVWILRSLQPIASNDVPDDHKPFVSDMAGEFFNKRTINRPKKETRYDLAILVNPDEDLPPSDEKAIRKFIKAAELLDFYTERITKEDISRINEFDALFIRETTSVNHHTYRMARRAAAEGLIVIDDPESILTCTNKVYLAELLTKNRVPVPDTVILNRDNIKEPPKTLGFPLILKQPDSSFSQGVLKVDSMEEYITETDNLFEKSDLLIAQKFIPTPFDWRIGILNGTPLYACRYHMARKHWQIYERTGDGKTHEGNADTIPVDAVPSQVLKNALKAAQLIGDGLYGVDLKEIDGDAFVIEVNDNPNIDSGIEDEYLKDDLYEAIMKEILRRIELKKEKRTS
ncbi:RimK family protein [Rhodohalobacter sp. 8-1]|uniref:RimK family protein n=1 Tax=Rhodohalobacter sp. 8-1 TaxID=3131972 RepID=UPI0030EF5CC3